MRLERTPTRPRTCRPRRSHAQRGLAKETLQRPEGGWRLPEGAGARGGAQEWLPRCRLTGPWRRRGLPRRRGWSSWPSSSVWWSQASSEARTRDRASFLGGLRAEPGAPRPWLAGPPQGKLSGPLARFQIKILPRVKQPMSSFMLPSWLSQVGSNVSYDARGLLLAHACGRCFYGPQPRCTLETLYLRPPFFPLATWMPSVRRNPVARQFSAYGTPQLKPISLIVSVTVN